MNILGYTGREGYFHIRGEGQKFEDALELDDYCELIFKSITPDEIVDSGAVRPRGQPINIFRWRVKIHASLIHYHEDEEVWFETASMACARTLNACVIADKVSRLRLIKCVYKQFTYYMPRVNGEVFA